jgi:hypothetical protein
MRPGSREPETTSASAAAGVQPGWIRRRRVARMAPARSVPLADRTRRRFDRRRGEPRTGKDRSVSCHIGTVPVHTTARMMGATARAAWASPTTQGVAAGRGIRKREVGLPQRTPAADVLRLGVCSRVACASASADEWRHAAGRSEIPGGGRGGRCSRATDPRQLGHRPRHRHGIFRGEAAGERQDSPRPRGVRDGFGPSGGSADGHHQSRHPTRTSLASFGGNSRACLCLGPY